MDPPNWAADIGEELDHLTCLVHGFAPLGPLVVRPHFRCASFAVCGDAGENPFHILECVPDALTIIHGIHLRDLAALEISDQDPARSRLIERGLPNLCERVGVAKPVESLLLPISLS